jgi:ATP-dependent Clp protease ATP-binding subunit ClpA
MGVTKQAAQKRFTPGATQTPDASQFARFTDEARLATVTAHQEAARLRHAEITPGHILLGVLAVPDSLPARAIVSLGGSLADVREQTEAKLGPAVDDAPTGHVPFSGPSKKVLELTVREALRLGDNYVGIEHILLGLLELDPALVDGVTTAQVEALVIASRNHPAPGDS